MSFAVRRREGGPDRLRGKEMSVSRGPAPPPRDDDRSSVPLANRILDAAGPQPGSRQLMRAALEELRDWTGCEAAGIRLEEGEDYPYIIEQGFSAKYLRTDNSLLGLGPDRKVLHDEQGRPVLECACGDIIRGRVPLGHPLFTAAGTFWYGSTREAAATLEKAKLPSAARGCCAAGGYESAACIPLKSHGAVFGILQLNSKRKQAITADMLSVLEPAIAVFAGVLHQQLANEALGNREMLHEALSAAMVEAFAYCRLYYDERGLPSDWAFVAANDAFRKLFGTSDPVAKRLSQVHPGLADSAPEILQMCGRTVATGRPEKVERYFDYFGKWLALRVSSPAPGHFLAVYEDISERKRAEEKLLRMQTSLDVMSDYPLWIDAECRIVDVSESACRRLGYSREELLGMTVFDLDPFMSPERWANHWSTIRQTGSLIIESQHRTKSGGLFPVQIATTHVDFGGAEYDCSFCRDISDHKRTEENLRRLQFSVDHMGDYPMWIDANGKICDVSESTCRHLEYSREELLRLTVFEVDRGQTPDRWPTAWKATAESGPRIVEIEHVTKSGRRIPVEASINRVLFLGEEYDCVFCRDISERRHAEDRLQRMQYSLDHIHDYPIWIDSSGRIVEVSESTCRHLEYSREELIGMRTSDIDPGPPQGKKRVETWEGFFFGTGATVFESRHRTKSGRWYPVEVAATPVVFDGVEYMCSFCRDISDRKRLEEGLYLAQLSVDQAPDGVFWIDAKGRVVYANESICDYSGYSRAELQSLYMWDIDPEVTPEVFALRWKAGADPGGLHHEGAFRRKDGRSGRVQVSSKRVVFEGKELGIAFVRPIEEPPTALPPSG